MVYGYMHNNRLRAWPGYLTINRWWLKLCCKKAQVLKKYRVRLSVFVWICKERGRKKYLLVYWFETYTRKKFAVSTKSTTLYSMYKSIDLLCVIKLNFPDWLADVTGFSSWLLQAAVNKFSHHIHKITIVNE